MAFYKVNTELTVEREFVSIDREKVTVSRVRFINDTTLGFNLNLPGLSLYNMRLIETKDGKRYIVPPSDPYTNKDGQTRYAKRYSIFLSNFDSEFIIGLVMKAYEIG